MTARLLSLVLLAYLIEPVLGEEFPNGHLAECQVAQHQIENSFLLPHVTRAIAAKHLNILVIGAGSSVLPGSDGTKDAYPARLQAYLAKELPEVVIKLETDVRSHRTAIEMMKALPADLVSVKPALVVWQTGTVDAMEAVDLDQFSEALEKGIAIAHNASSDVVLVNAQYSPRTESMIALGTYADNMRWIAVQEGVPLFDRFSVMKLWADLGIFNLYASTKKLDVAIRIHDCIGRLLADLILDATKQKTPLVDSIQ
jgi:hypothetical protein